MRQAMLYAAVLGLLSAGLAQAQYADDNGVVDRPQTLGDRIRRGIFGSPEPQQYSKPKPKAKSQSQAAPPASAKAGGTRTPLASKPSASSNNATNNTAAAPAKKRQAPPPRTLTEEATGTSEKYTPFNSAAEDNDRNEPAPQGVAAPKARPSSRRRHASTSESESSFKANDEPSDDAPAEPKRFNSGSPSRRADPDGPQAFAPKPLRDLTDATQRSPEPGSDKSPRVARSERTRETPRPELVKQEPAKVDDPRDAADNQMIIERKSPVISVETSGPRRITVGKDATYTVTIKNTGDMVANDVVVSVSVPSYAEVLDARASAGTSGYSSDRDGEGYQWKISSLGAHSSQELALKIIPRKSQGFDLGVKWTYSPASSMATVEVEEPKLQMSISGPTTVVYGEEQLYKLTISNPGTGDADNVTIVLVPITPSDGPAASHRLGTLRAGASKSVEIELTARQAGQLNIQAAATADGGLKASAAQSVLVRRAALQVAVAGPRVHYAGAPATYEIRVKNTGDSMATAVSLVAALPPDTVLVSASHDGHGDTHPGQVRWLLEQLAPGAEQAFVVKCLMKTTGINRIEATATAEGDLRNSQFVTTQVMALADLVLEVSDAPGPVAVGDETIYDLRIRNRGTSSADGVEIVAFFSEGLEPISAEGARHEIASGTVTFKTIASLAAGAEATYKIKARAERAGNHRIRVELQCESLGAKLTQEDTTLFYGEDTVSSGTQPAAKDAEQLRYGAGSEAPKP
jgi:uncharacterized repeat protein (TIGR01451 family)